MNCNNVPSMGVPEREEGKKEQKKYSDIMAEKSPNLLKNINVHIWKAQQIPKRINKSDSLS